LIPPSFPLTPKKERKREEKKEEGEIEDFGVNGHFILFSG
jgi:hypothetical protein